jgi:hypothetical protein
MKTNWKHLLEANNAKIFVLPEGWDSKEELAKQIPCGEDRVRIFMAPMIKARQAEMKTFPVWDKVTKRVVRVTAYRHIPQRAKKK